MKQLRHLANVLGKVRNIYRRDSAASGPKEVGEVKIDVEQIKEEWLVGNAVVAFVGALLMAQAWEPPDSVNVLPILNVTVPTLPQAVILGIIAFLVSLSFVLALASVIPPLRSRAIHQVSPYSQVLEWLMWVAFLLSLLSALTEIPLDQWWAEALGWGGLALLFFLAFRMILKPLIPPAKWLARMLFGLAHRTWRRRMREIPIRTSTGEEIRLSLGRHNRLQARVVTDFGPKFAPGATLVYLGDAANRLLHLDRKMLAELGVPITEHDKLPDVVLYDEERNWLFLVEAVTSHGPVNPKRVEELESTLKDCDATRVYVSAFPDFRQVKQHVDKIAWETEVWLAEIPDHLIHFNGDKFLGSTNA